MDNNVAQKLLESIQLNRLVMICGAGLSISPPSSLPSASNLAVQCSSIYDSLALPDPLPPNVREDLGQLTEFLFQKGEQNFFVRKLVNWAPFRGTPNRGHLAFADFLTCSAAEIGITTNYDDLIEQSASILGEKDFESALDGTTASVPREHKPLLKIHGSVHDKDHTLWCQSQLWRGNTYGPNSIVRKRIISSRDWLIGHLQERDLIIVGFWSDWPYLNRTLLACLRSLTPPFVVLVDKGSKEDLKRKAPMLWHWAEAKSLVFKHVQQSADEFLDELRNVYSRNFLEQMLLAAVPGFNALATCETPDTGFDLSTDDLYALRRDACGVPSGKIPRARQPEISMDAVGRAHLLFRRAGAKLDGPSYMSEDGRRARVVNGLTKVIGQVKAEFSSAPPSPIPNDIVICAGADDDGNAPSDIIRGGQQPDMVRNGIVGEWMTLQTAREKGIV
jgi:hypothetical protein